ncbi:protein LYK5-like, partial [Carya illinoinensis]|uniref:protein LYK5-like n=1 Tax=Carya illinoinensis TaxID=32201 RepID=UPI001C71F583
PTHPLPTLAPPIKKPQSSYENSWSISTEGFHHAIESLTVYKFDEKATGFFREANRIKGSVYRGSFKGDTAAVKVMKGDVSSEINLLTRINHSNIIRLSGFCVHGGSTYLVYEHAKNGSLNDWLQSNKLQNNSPLTWKQRFRLPIVADALNYLHNYANQGRYQKEEKCRTHIVLRKNDFLTLYIQYQVCLYIGSRLQAEHNSNYTGKNKSLLQ